MYNEEIHILRAGELLYTLPIDDNAQCVHRLMGECTIELELRYEQPLLLQPGDYVEWNNVRYSLDEEPDYSNDEGIYVYDLTFYAYRALNHIIHKDEGSMTFPYVGSAHEHLSALLKSIRDEDPEWELGTIEGDGTQSIDFDGTYCIDALTQICQAFELEWRIENKTIHALKRVGTDTPYSFEVGQGKGLYTLEVKGVTNQKVTTRLYGYGAAINLPTNYRENDIPKPDALVFDGRYLESNVDKYGVREDVVVFDDIFPRLKDAELTGITVPVDPTAVSTWTVLVSLPFDINDHLAEDEAQIKFTSGELTGEAFVITSYNHTSGELRFSASEDNGYVLPSETRQPHVGDGFVLLNITMPDTYVTAAEEELRTATAEELVKRHEKTKAYTLDIDPRHVRNAQIGVVPGDSVRVIDAPSGLDSAVRITEVSYTLQNPEKLSFVLSDTPLYESLADKIEADINNVSQGVNQVKNTSDTSLSFWNRAFEIRKFGDITAIVAKLHFVGSKTISQLGDGSSVPTEGGEAGLLSLGSLTNVGAWADDVGDEDVLLFRPKGSSVWGMKRLSDLVTGGGGGGTLYHDQLEHLDYPDQHPIASIIGLQSALDAKANINGDLSKIFQAAIIGVGDLGEMMIAKGRQISGAFGEDEFTIAYMADKGRINLVSTGNPTYTPKSSMSTRYELWHSGNLKTGDFLGFTGDANSNSLLSSKVNGYGYAYQGSGSPANGSYLSFGYNVAGGYTQAQLLMTLSSNPELYLRYSYGENQWSEWRRTWHSGNSNLSTVDWSAKILRANEGVRVQTEYGISLAGDFSGYKNPMYGLYTANPKIHGTHGDVTSDFAMYLTVSGYNEDTYNHRGWIFRDQTRSKNVASISSSGTMVLEGNLIVKGTITQLGG